MSSTLEQSPLVRLLARWAPPRAAAPAPDLADGLAQWVTAFDAIGLQSALRAVKAVDAGAPGQPVDAAALAADFARTRAALAGAIAQDAALPNESAYTPYKRRHLELQRQMDQAAGALRGRLRQALARGTPEQRRLALLDAALEKIMARREQAVLPATVALLERRFQALRKAWFQQAGAEAEQDDNPFAWRRPGGWLHAFEQDWRQALAAELALRLEPAAGLVEAAGIALNDF